mmetsp:Transcript_16536/g.42401  ORF Transcript_16536/g.42401 Transcript_16536/m.42401 type:complete len:224 (+) Transcript_16536:749-1420(+)
MAAPRGVLAHPFVPRHPAAAQPLDHRQVPVLRGRRHHPLVAARGARRDPLHHRQVPPGRRIHQAALQPEPQRPGLLPLLRRRPLQDAQVARGRDGAVQPPVPRHPLARRPRQQVRAGAQLAHADGGGRAGLPLTEAYRTAGLGAHMPQRAQPGGFQALYQQRHHPRRDFDVPGGWLPWQLHVLAAVRVRRGLRVLRRYTTRGVAGVGHFEGADTVPGLDGVGT